ncbi:MAG: SDR family oxidoreductase [Gammaproteobacteria bacterium]|nr:SDR family oxidoreductase [Gammaproteobacteria bacterium]
MVTGVSGFVGQILCRKALDVGYIIRGAVRATSNIISPPYSTPLLEGVHNIVAGDIGADTDWAHALAGIDVVVHLAARVHVMNDTVSDPLAEFRKVNVAGTERLARSAAAAGVRRFVFLSSIKVNGEGSERGFSDNDAPNPQDPYAISKWEAEQVLHRIAIETGLEVVIIRPPLVYGPGVGANFLRLLRWVDKGVPLPLGMVHNQRSLIYIGNLVDAIFECIKNPAAAGKTYLVSDGADVSTPELIRKLASAMGRDPHVLPIPESLLRLTAKLVGRSSEVDRLLGSLAIDSSRIRSELDWVPPFTLEQGLQDTVRWYRTLHAK